MKKYLTILSVLFSTICYSQLSSIVVRNDTIFNVNPLSNVWIALNPHIGGGGATWGSIVGSIGNQTDLQTSLSGKQASLVSGTNIKTVNGNSLLGSGDVSITSAVAWGAITGTLSSQTDLQTALNAKQATITTGTSSQYLAGDLSLVTFPTTTASFSNSTNKNFVTDAQLTVIGNTSGTNTGDNATNSQYANDFRSANFVAGTNYLAPNGSAASLTNNTGGWTELHVTGSNATTTGQSLIDITGLVSATLANSTRYEVEAVLQVSTSNVTTGTEYGIATGGTGGASVVNAIIHGTTTAAAATEQTINTASTATTAYLTASSISGTVWIKGFVTTRGAGTATISIQHLKVTSGTSTVLIGSVFRYRLAQ